MLLIRVIQKKTAYQKFKINKKIGIILAVTIMN